MRASKINLIVLCGFLLFVLLFWILRAPDRPKENHDQGAAAPESAGVQAGDPHSVTESGPDASNVTHAVKAEIDRLRTRVASAPADTAALSELGRLLQDAHQLDEAAGLYERYLRRRRNNPQVWLDLANCYALLNRWDDAKAASEELLTMVPGHPAAMYNLGATYANLGDSESAIMWWEKVKEQTADPNLSAKAAAVLSKIRK